MKKKYGILSNIWTENKYPISIIYGLNIIEEVFYLLIPSSVGLLIDTFVYNKGYGIFAFIVTYIGWQGTATYRKIRDTITFTKIFNQVAIKVINDHQQKDISTTKINARVELMKQVVQFFEEDLPFLVKSIISVLGSCILLYFYNYKLLFVSIIIIVPSLIINYFYSKKIVSATENINDQYEHQIDIIHNKSLNEQVLYFTQLREMNIKKSTLEAYNFGMLELFVFIMIISSIYVVCKTENLNYGSIVASYGIILRLAYGFDFIPHTTTRLATLKDISNRLNETF